MKRSLVFLFALAVVMFVVADLVQAQTGGSGVIGYNLSNAGRVRIANYPYSTANSQVGRTTPTAALNKNAVFDYNEDANSTTYLSQKITLAGVDEAVRTVCNNSYSNKPPKVRVEITVYFWAGTKYIIYRYRFYNDSTATLPLYLGSFTLPMPAGSYGGETVVYNISKRTAYSYRNGTAMYTSQKLLNKNLYSMRIRDWDAYSSDPSSDVATDSVRYLMASETANDTLLTAGVDGVVFCMNGGLSTMAPKDSVDLYFGMGIGATAAEAIALMDSAQAKFNKVLTSVEKITVVVPTHFVLEQNYPNPFNPSTQIRFLLPARGNVTLTVYDALGRTIRTLVNQHLDAGEYVSTFDATGLSSGVYYYVLRAGSLVESKRMVLIR
jgi:hypothetical protein